MSSPEHPLEQQPKPVRLPLTDALNAPEEEIVEGNFDWSPIHTSPELIQLRKDVMQWAHEQNPDMNESLSAQIAARVETSWKARRYEQLSEQYGESDERVVQLREDLHFWQALLGSPPSRK